MSSSQDDTKNWFSGSLTYGEGLKGDLCSLKRVLYPGSDWLDGCSAYTICTCVPIETATSALETDFFPLCIV
jgi:hypothetical protein